MVLNQDGEEVSITKLIPLLRTVFANRTLGGLRVPTAESPEVVAAESRFKLLLESEPRIVASAVMRCLAMGIWTAHEENVACLLLGRALPLNQNGDFPGPEWLAAFTQDTHTFLIREYTDDERTLGVEQGIFCCFRVAFYQLLAMLRQTKLYPALDIIGNARLANPVTQDERISSLLLATSFQLAGEELSTLVWAPRVAEALADEDPDVVFAGFKLAVELLVESTESLDNAAELLRSAIEVPQILYRADRRGLSRICLNQLGQMAGPQFSAEDVAEAMPALMRFLVELQQKKDEDSSFDLITSLLEMLDAHPKVLIKHYPQMVSPIALFCISGFINNSEWSIEEIHSGEDSGSSSEHDFLPFKNAQRYAGLLSWLGITTNSTDLLNLVLKFDVRLSKSTTNPTHRAIVPYFLHLLCEGCPEETLTKLPDLLPSMLARTSDADPRVRFTIAVLMGGLAEDLGGKFVRKFAKMCVPHLCALLDDACDTVAEVAAHACWNWFSSTTSAEHIQPHLPELFTRLCTLLGSDDERKQLASLCAIGGLPELLQEEFVPLWPKLEPLLRALWAKRDSLGEPQLSQLIDALILTGMGYADGFREFVEEIAEWLATSPFDSSMPIYFLTWGRILPLLKDEAIVGVLPTLIDAHLDAMKSDKFIGVDVDVEAEDGTNINVGGRNIQLNSGLIERTGLALASIRILISHVQDRQTFEQIRASLDSLVMISWAPNLVVKALFAYQKLFVAAKAHPEFECNVAEAFDTLSSVVENLIFDWSIEDLESPALLGYVVRKLLSAVGSDITQEAGTTIHRCIVKALSDLESEPEEDEELAISFELIDYMPQWTNKLYKHLGRDIYGPLFRADIERSALALIRSPDNEQINLGLCLIHDQIEFAAEPSVIKQIMPSLANFALHKSKDIRQAAVSALGFCALNCGPEFEPNIAKTAALLNRVISAKDARSKYIYATENAVAAFARLLVAWHSKIPVPALKQFVLFFLQSLPVDKDQVEAPLTYKHLVQLINAVPNVFLGDANENVPGLHKMFLWLETCDPKLILPETRNELAVLRQKYNIC